MSAPPNATTMDTNDVTIGRIVAVGLGVYVALAGAATLVWMPWQYTSGGVALAALRILGSVAAVVGGAALAWIVVNAGENASAAGGTLRSQ